MVLTIRTLKDREPNLLLGSDIYFVENDYHKNVI